MINLFVMTESKKTFIVAFIGSNGVKPKIGD